MRKLKLWWPKCYLENYARIDGHAVEIAAELEKLGIKASEDSRNAHVALCGSVWFSEEISPHCRRRRLPLAQYNWDIYPWQVEGTAPECKEPHLWAPYIEALKYADEVWVPSESAAKRTQEFTGRPANLVPCSVITWDHEVGDDGYVVDVMRPYPDPNCNAVRDACVRLNIPYVKPSGNLSREEYQRTIARARVLVSPYYEASTGGLSLLEGYYLGKDVLISDSEYQGARDYFGDRATYFKWNDPSSLEDAIDEMVKKPRVVTNEEIQERREWLSNKYSAKAMARRMASRFYKMVK